MFGREIGAQHMFAQPAGVPGRAIAGGRQEPVDDGEDDLVESGPFHLRRQRCTVMAPDIVLKPLLLIIVISLEDSGLRSHRVNSICRYGAKGG